MLDDGDDVTVSLLREGYARLRGDKSGAEHIDQYKDAEEDAQVSESGLWN